MDQAQRAVQTESNEVLYDVADHIAVITLDAPERMNTISGPMLNDLTRLLIEANEDRNVRCVILTGTGRAFCAGLDLRKERSGDGLSSASSATSLDLRNTPPTVLQAMDKPTICAVKRRSRRLRHGYRAWLRYSHHGGIGQTGGSFRQTRGGAGVGWHLAPAADDRLGQGL
jgi:1,4-dihydroxy-2-naphthoyl-CoA synthase